MANIDIDVAGRRYNVACRDGEEEHLRALASLVDRRAQDAAAALGGLTESRQLLFAALLIAQGCSQSSYRAVPVSSLVRNSKLSAQAVPPEFPSEPRGPPAHPRLPDRAARQ